MSTKIDEAVLVRGVVQYRSAKTRRKNTTNVAVSVVGYPDKKDAAVEVGNAMQRLYGDTFIDFTPALIRKEEAYVVQPAPKKRMKRASNRDVLKTMDAKVVSDQQHYESIRLEPFTETLKGGAKRSKVWVICEAHGYKVTATDKTSAEIVRRRHVSKTAQATKETTT